MTFKVSESCIAMTIAGEERLEKTQWPEGLETELQGYIYEVVAICKMPLSCPNKGVCH